MARQVNGFVGNFTSLTDLNNKYPPAEHAGCSANFITNGITVKYWSNGTAWGGGNPVALQALVSGAGSLVGDSVAAPVGAITIASTATAGNLTGTYYYNVTYVTESGETAPWPGTPNSTGAITSKQVSLSGIPVSSDPKVIARKLWRSDGTTTEPKDYQYLATINDNTTTTYVDNTPANSGITPNWNATNRGQLTDGSSTVVARFSDQTTSLGYGTFANGTPGYASTAVGYNALYDNTSGRRNVAIGVYALENNTTGYENTCVGTHSGGGNTTAFDCTLVGYSVGSATHGMGNANTIVGAYAFSSALTKGANNTAIGYGALQSQTSGWSSCIAVGYSAGKYSDAASQLFIDSRDRTDITGCKDGGLIYGEMSATVASQQLRINGITRLGSGSAPVVSSLPAASASYKGFRGYVTDASVPYTSANLGTTVAGGGGNCVPVFCTGTAWVIG